jgi:class 3 adenylate cyclase/tetratricopeptide (TPR) repeat protein
VAAERTLERRIVTVLFADVVGFTALSEELDPEDVVAVQDAYFAAVRETVARYGGTLEKFIGDAAVAVFGVPRVRDDDAVRAVRAGLALTSAVDQLGARLGLTAGELRLRVGVNTGEVVYGEATADRGTVTGDTVNVAARLQAAARPGGVLVGEATALASDAAVELEPAGALELKGKAEPTPAWHVLGELAEPSREHAMGGLRAPMLGREAELERLRGLLDGLDEGGACGIVVLAPPGVGKTRLTDELVRAASDAAVFRARLRPDVLAPYDGVAQLFTSAIGVDDSIRDRLAGTDPARAAVVAEAVEAVLFPAAAAEGEPANRDAVFAAWLEAFDALTGGRRALWVVEDAHWAGGDLLAFVSAASSPPAGAARLVVVTGRPALRERFQLDEELDLPALSPPMTATLIGELVGDALPDDLSERIADASDGNPLFVEELLRAWASSGLLVYEGDEWRLAAPPDAVTVPSTVQTIYAAQLDDLPPPARLAARRASVPGRRFPRDALEPLGVEDADEGLGVLTRRALISGPDADALFGSTYAFRHALLRDAGYASLARAERAELHVALARWLEEVARDRRAQIAEVIGRHYAAAVESAPRLAAEVAAGLTRPEAARAAASWFELGAETALDLAAHETARALLIRALEFTDPDSLDAARRRRRLGEAIAPSADMDEAAAELERAHELAARLLPAARAEYTAATASLGWVYNQQVRFDDAARLADEALATLGEADDVETAKLLVLRGMAVGYGTDVLETALADVGRGAEIAHRLGAPEVELEALLFQARVVDTTSDEAVAQLRRVRELGLARRGWAAAANALRTEAMLLLERDRGAAAAALDEAEALARSRSLLEELAWTEYTRAELGLLYGEWDAAVAAGLRAADLVQRYGYRRAGIRSWYVLIPIASARGDEELLRRGHDLSERFRPHFPVVPAPWARVMSTAADLRFKAAGLSRTARYQPDEDAALPAFHDWAQLPSWYEAVDVLLAAWLAEPAVDRVRTALETAERAVERAPERPLIFPAVLEFLRARMGEGDARRAAGAFRELGAPAWLARALRLLGEDAEAETLERQLGIRA